jgi:hypothetical protein
MTEIRDAAVNFESVKLSLKQDKSGFILTMAIHPNDVPDSLLRDWVGSRYMVAMVKMDDEDKPIEPPEVAEGKKAVQMAGTLCKEEKFQRWLGEGLDMSEDEAAEALCEIVGISSRSELKTNAAARKHFLEIVGGFKRGMGR